MVSSAIPDHLHCARTRPASLRPGFQAPYPAYSVRFPEHASQLVMAIIGAQYQSEADVDGAAQSMLSTFLTCPSNPPSFIEWASVTDNKGFYNLSALGYWPSKAAYEAWAEKSGFLEWWQALKPEACQHGWFLEVFFPTMDRIETLFNTTDAVEGFAHMGEAMSGEVQEHGYWGSMRDRLPISQTDSLPGTPATAEDFDSPEPSSFGIGSRVKIPGKKNLVVIRSGQNWLDTSPAERELYLDTMHPVLIKGMNFLRDQGDQVGCYSCRFMEIVDPVTTKADNDRTFGLAYFDDLGSLERWCREHPTHLAIFGGFHQYARKLNNNVTLRVFHEVMVLEPEQQLFEYVACHPGTGMWMIGSG
ncbi:phenylacetaldoxime dehydratase [Parathielavia appendiculata]|uniref:Phenylacetaldoxime dehydratase n=1 Tax=Parathielavia appendiculata TaxID=2587402 RepID=A0AAN6UAI7_9PEZI|nr:phenylacetaldoxime dehydratase [Parathielavia appendiculata]